MQTVSFATAYWPFYKQLFALAFCVLWRFGAVGLFFLSPLWTFCAPRPGNQCGWALCPNTFFFSILAPCADLFETVGDFLRERGYGRRSCIRHRMLGKGEKRECHVFDCGGQARKQKRATFWNPNKLAQHAALKNIHSGHFWYPRSFSPVLCLAARPLSFLWVRRVLSLTAAAAARWRPPVLRRGTLATIKRNLGRSIFVPLWPRAQIPKKKKDISARRCRPREFKISRTTIRDGRALFADTFSACALKTGS
nr:hypothetical protein [Pandoravirus massiliensis]